jgi:hypothetical protein
MVVMAILGFDDQMKQRIDHDITSDDSGVQLILYFSTDGAGCRPEQGYTPSIVNFRSEQRVGDALILSGSVLKPGEGYGPAAPGDYAFRSASVRWYPTPIRLFQSDTMRTQISSTKESLGFSYPGGPMFVGAFRMSLDASEQIVLTEIEASPELQQAAKDRLGVTGDPPRANTGRRELVRCMPIGPIVRLGRED